MKSSLYTSVNKELALLTELLAAPNNASGGGGFLMTSIDRMEQAIQLEITRCETAARALLTKIQSDSQWLNASFSTTNGGGASPSFLVVEAEREQACALEIARSIQYYQSSVTDMVVGNQAAAKAVHERFTAKKPWTSGAVANIVVLLSDVFEAIRALKKNTPGTSSTLWVAPDSFDRSTSKYWVEESKLSQLLLTCVGEAPLLVYGKSGQLSAQIPSPGDAQEVKHHDVLWEKLSTKVSSIYFDSVNLDLYRERLARREGAQLFRVRWYGSLPRGDKPIFLELKTHHESWIQAKSVKERATILESDMKTFLDLSQKLTVAEAEKIW